MKTPVTDAEREAIAADVRGGMARNDVARKHGRGAGTVSRIAKELGLSFERSPAIVAATKARQVDVEARIVALAEDLLEDAERLRKQLWEPCEMHSFGGRDNVHNSIELDEPVFADKRHIVGSVRMLATTVNDIRSRSKGGDEGASMIVRLVAGLAQSVADAAEDAA